MFSGLAYDFSRFLQRPQVAIATELGVTQQAVSKWLREPTTEA